MLFLSNEAGVNMTAGSTTTPQLFAGKSIVVTGSLERWERREIETLSEESEKELLLY